ncbi:MAG: ATP-independent RNA helicase DbpA [Pseudohongiellaceae bacterium]
MPTNFADLALAPELLAVLSELGYDQPTSVQAQSIPVLLDGKDLIGQSMTGSGKTAAFALPILQTIPEGSRSIHALVLCPTRELCAQVARETRKLGRRHPGLVVVEIIGGQPIGPQMAALNRGVHIVVGTPGRLLDHLKRRTLRTASVKTVVLDEADRMLDMGFGEDVEKILKVLPPARQTAMFSATFPPSIEALSSQCQRAAVRVTIEGSGSEALEIRQMRLTTDVNDRFHGLCWLLNRYPHEAALVFCNLKATVFDLSQRLAASGVSVGRLDGDLDQFQRDQVLARFRNQSVRVLIATDVAGRGIDIPDLDLVINFELPHQAETYVHRIGRTGRAGKSGVAASLTTTRQEGRIREIQDLTGVQIEVLRLNGENDPGLEALLEQVGRPPTMETVLISGGRKDKVRAGDILGALTGEAGSLKSADIGKIEVQDRLSYVAVSRSVVQHAVTQLNRGRIKGRRFRATLVGVAG